MIGSSGTNYGPVTVSGSGTSYTITLAQPINAADRVTITIGNTLIASFTRRLDVLPGDVNDDGVVNVQDMVAIRNQMLGLLGAVPTIFGDINGDGKVDILDYTAVRKLHRHDPTADHLSGRDRMALHRNPRPEPGPRDAFGYNGPHECHRRGLQQSAPGVPGCLWRCLDRTAQD